nr:hypothetical protein [Microbacterium invictum]
MIQDHATSPTAHSVGGLSVEQSGYLLDTVTAPAAVGARGVLSFRVLNPDGAPLTEYAVDHEKDLHLIVVRSDGTQFRHVHPTRDRDGTWSTPWTWEAAGSYRVYADFRTSDGGEPVDVTLTRTVEVPGPYTPAVVAVKSSTTVDGYEAAVTGALQAGVASKLTISVTKDGSPVTALQPYLGAFGHLVALRVGDLAYLHVHPEGDTPAAGQTAGPEVVFIAEAPTAGRYLLFFDFQADGQVRTAALTVDAAAVGSADSGTGAGHGADH